nr:gliding motility-associated C-terminal domain-containing protein [uncultured Flavobacterium sp.]
MKKVLVVVLFFLLSNLSFGQLTSFTLQVTPTNETCSGNGVLSFTVSNTTPGASIVYTIYHLPDVTTPIAITSANSFTGLVAGNYTVVATQTLGALSNSQQQGVTIISQVVPLQYTLIGQNILCGNDGRITVNVTQGNPVGYEIISGPMTAPLQASNVFTGLTVGTYVVRVFDNCGDGIVSDITLTRPLLPNVDINQITTDNLTCSTLDLLIRIASGPPGSQNIMVYPLTMQITVFPPSGAPVIISQTYATGNTGSEELVLQMPFYYDQLYTYNIVITDGCGNVYQQNNNEIDLHLGIDIHETMEVCDKHLVVAPYNFVAPYTVNFVSAPAGFNPVMYNAGHPGPFSTQTEYFNNATPYPEGTYTIQITDACGRTFTRDYTTQQLPLSFGVVESLVGCTKELIINVGTDVAFTVEFLSAPAGFDPIFYNSSHPGPFTSDVHYYNAAIPYPDGVYVIRLTDECGRTATTTYSTNPIPVSANSFVLPGCDVGSGSVLMIINDAMSFQSVHIVAAPATFTQPLPYNVSQNIQTDANQFSMNSLPAGNYTFEFVDSCNRTGNHNVTIAGYQILSEVVTVTEHCSSFDVYLNYITNSSSNNFWLQKYDPATNTWGHPQTGVSGGPPNPFNSILLTNTINNVNYYYMGRFRVVTTFYVFADANDNGVCETVIHEFEYSSGPKISNIYSFSCANNMFDVILEAAGADPLQFRITTRNGIPFMVNNGSSSLFTGLQPGVYNFQIEDSCGNILNRVYDISSPLSFSISADNLCDGSTGSLLVPYFSFLNYEWWKDNNTTTILSTTNVLSFPNFNSPGDFGTYHVRITNPGNPNSCMNSVLDFTISSALNNPQAGTGATVSLCGTPGNINLFDHLTGSYDTFGEWEEISSSNMLINHIWNASGISSGVYTFRYRVEGLCDSFDEALVQITINPIPQNPVASGDAVVCEGQSLHLFASDIPGVTYQWMGPNGFLSNDQNPIVDNITTVNQGVYSVQAIQNGCESVADTIEVAVGTSPFFTLRNHCENNLTYLSATLIDSAIDPQSVTYSWTAPDGATLNVNPINVTGNTTGIYTLTVTNAQGCTDTKSIEIACTNCGIPRGVSPNDDGLNDNFDLSCLSGIVNAKIFNRYGVTVYELDDYADQWHGQDFKDRLLPTGTYYYLIKFDSGESKTGWVYLNY